MSGSNSPVAAREKRWDVAIRCAVLLPLVAAYRLSFAALHGAVGNPAFLVGLVPCMAAAELRHVRGAVPVVITSGFQAQDASKLLHVPNVIGFLDKPHTLRNLESVLAALGARRASAGAA